MAMKEETKPIMTKLYLGAETEGKKQMDIFRKKVLHRFLILRRVKDNKQITLYLK